EEAVIHVPAAVVPHRGADRLGNGIEVGDDLLGALAVKPRMGLEGGIEVLRVPGVVLAVMDLHRARVDVRLERVERIAEVGEGEGVAHSAGLLIVDLERRRGRILAVSGGSCRTARGPLSCFVDLTNLTQPAGS